MFDETTVTRAVNEANKTARTTLLRSGSSLTRLMPDISRPSLFILRQQWEPFRAYEDVDGSWGLQLRVEEDSMVRLAMRDDACFEELHSIGTQGLYDEMASESFMHALLTHVILENDTAA